MANFGGLNDPFTIATEDLILQEQPTYQVDALDRADATDENGDIAASAYYGNTEGELISVSATYVLKANTLDLSTLKCGELSTGVVVESIEATTGNGGEMPKITVTGKLGTKAITAPSGHLNTFSLPEVTLTAAFRAQEMGFTTGEGCRLTGSTLTASVTLSQEEDGLGEPVAHGLSGGTIEVSADFVAITADPSWTVSAEWLTETQEPGRSEGQAAWHTGTGTAAGTLSRDSAA